jgi:hypothetical protein
VRRFDARADDDAPENQCSRGGLPLAWGEGMRPAWVAVFVLGALVAAPRDARAGGALGRFEGAHTSSGSSSSSSSSSSGSSSKSSDSNDDANDSNDSSESGGGSGDTSAVGCLAAIATVVLAGVCMPPARIAIDPYDGDDIYVRPHVDPDTNARFYPGGSPIARNGELSLSGFAATNERVYAHDLQLRGWLGPVMGGAEWDRYYEPSKTGSADTLDLFRAHVGSNFLGPLVPHLELYPLVGATAMRGAAGVIGAFDVGAEARVYPVRPLAIYASSIVSIFAQGPVLVDSRAELGVALGRVELRIGGRSLFQPGAQSFLGPVASVVLRL